MSVSTNYSSPSLISRSLRLAPGAFLTMAIVIPLASGFLSGQVATPSSSADALFRSGKASAAAGKYQEAEDAFRRVYELEPGNIRGIMGLAEVFLQQKKESDAILLLQLEADKNVNRPDLRKALGNVLVRTGKYDLAIAEFQKAVDSNGQKNPEEAADLYTRIGESYRRKGEVNLAIAAFERARDAAPNQTAALLRIALLLEGSGKTGPAKAAYEQVLKLQPDQPVALNNLAYLSAQTGGTGDLEKALDMAQKARELAPNSPHTADTLGWLYLQKRMNDQAVAAFKEAVRQASAADSSIFRYHLAMALNEKGEASNALEELQRALKNNASAEVEQQIKELMKRIEH